MKTRDDNILSYRQRLMTTVYWVQINRGISGKKKKAAHLSSFHSFFEAIQVLDLISLSLDSPAGA